VNAGSTRNMQSLLAVADPVPVKSQPVPRPVLTFKGLAADGSLTLGAAEAGRFALAQAGDIVFTKQGHVSGWVLKKVGLVPQSVDALHVASTLQVIRPREETLSGWLYFWMSSRSTYERMQALLGGRAGLTSGALGALPVPAHGQQAQRRVVQILEEHLSRVDTANELLRAASARSLRLRTSALAELWSQSAKGRDLQPVGSLGAVVTGGTPPTREGDAFVGGVLPFVAPSDVAHGQRIYATARSLNAVGTATSRIVAGPSVAVVCIGATLGKVGWLDVPASGNQQINFVKPDDGVSAEYVAALMASPQFQRQMQDQASSTTMPILNKSKFMRLSLPIPLAVEQSALLARLQRVEEAHERLNRDIDVATARSGSLETGLLDAAFSGVLTSEATARLTEELDSV
jgi:type I restriction enzyme S subunit